MEKRHDMYTHMKMGHVIDPVTTEQMLQRDWFNL